MQHNLHKQKNTNEVKYDNILYSTASFVCRQARADHDRERLLSSWSQCMQNNAFAFVLALDGVFVFIYHSVLASQCAGAAGRLHD